jgi:hypothetical protein
MSEIESKQGSGGKSLFSIQREHQSSYKSGLILLLGLVFVIASKYFQQLFSFDLLGAKKAAIAQLLLFPSSKQAFLQ